MSAALIGDKYKLERLLGRGGMGEVHEATHISTGRRVAVKLLTHSTLIGDDDDSKRQEEIVARFAREARAAGQIDSPHVVEVLDAGVDASTGRPFMVMEYLTGEDLHHVLRRTGPLPITAALRITAQALAGLSRAHAAGVVHRDIKPANLFLAQERDALHVKVVDFGIARVEGKNDGSGDVTQDLTRTGSMLGSPTYMAPEQARGLRKIDARVDLWSLGIVLYKMLTGRTPHEKGDGGLGELLIAICCVPAPPVQDFAPWVPPEVAALVQKALAIDVSKRFGSADEMATAVSLLLGTPNVDLSVPDLVSGIPENDRSYVARRADDAPSVTHRNVLSVPVSEMTMVDPTQMTMGTGNISGPRRKRGVRVFPVIAIVAACALAGSVGALSWQRSRTSAALTGGSNVGAPGVLPGTPSSPSSPLSQTSSSPQTTVPNSARRVSVRVPVGASVEVDGAGVVVAGHQVAFDGVVGSQHRLRIFQGSETRTVMIGVMETGAMPEEVAFDKVVKDPGSTSVRGGQLRTSGAPRGGGGVAAVGPASGLPAAPSVRPTKLTGMVPVFE